MKIKPINDKKEFLKQIINSGYDQYCSFCIYPELHNTSTEKDNVKLSQNFIESDKFIKNININNHIMFLGLNAASRDDDEKKSYTRFQAMHDTSSHSRDFITARMINSIENSEIVMGSFITDIFYNVVATNLQSVSRLITKLKNTNSKFEVNQPLKAFEIPALNYPSLTNKVKKLKDENENNKKELNNVRQAIADKMYDHLMKYDLPTFNYFIKALDIHKLICFGNNTFVIAEQLLRICKIDSKQCKAYKVPHFSSSAKPSQRKEALEKAIND